MEGAIKIGRWKGLIASFILAGAGQFLSGARRRGVVWFVVIGALPFLLLSFYSLPTVPARAGVALVGFYVILWLVMLCDSYRPIAELRWWYWVLLTVVSLGLSALVQCVAHLFFPVYRVPTLAMAPTISQGDDVLLCRSAYWFHEPCRGDLIVFNTNGISGIPKDPAGKDVLFLKRLVGLPNDVVEIRGGNIWVNHQKMEIGDSRHRVHYHSLAAEVPGREVKSYTVPAGYYFVVGDNSEHSYDSRYWGAIRRAAIIGKVAKIYWPWDRMSTPR